MERRLHIRWGFCQGTLTAPLSLTELIKILRACCPLPSLPCDDARLDDLVVEPDLRQR